MKNARPPRKPLSIASDSLDDGSAAGRMSITILNPLPQALLHFENELLDCMGDSVSPIRKAIPCEGHRKLAKLCALGRYLAAALNPLDRTCVIVLWPVLGWLDIILWSVWRGESAHLIVHDPVPLRRQPGMGRAAQRLAKAWLRYRRPTVVVLSEEAGEEMRRLVGTECRLHVLPHPIKAPTYHLPEPQDRGLARHVLVAGQYKPARHLGLLTELAARLPEIGLSLRVRGRGWPKIDGGDVESTFLSEAELDDELRSARCVILPYRHYFQSGIAVRAVELGTPVIGQHNTFLTSLAVGDSITIVESETVDAWLQAISHTDSTEGWFSIESLHTHVAEQWQAFLTQAEERKK